MALAKSRYCDFNFGKNGDTEYYTSERNVKFGEHVIL